MFVSYGVVFGGLGRWLLEYQDTITRVLGVVTILFGLAFMGFIPGLQRTVKSGRLPAAGLAGAPLLGVLFGLGWTPCIGPTLGAVQGLAITEASAGRGALLSLAYCLGLGLPFVATAIAYRRALGAFGAVKRHYPWSCGSAGDARPHRGAAGERPVGNLTIELKSWISGFEPVI